MSVPSQPSLIKKIVGATRTAPVHRELVDRLMELYCDWRTRCAEVHAAYERFCKATAGDRPAAFGAYVAALDREESTCTSYAAQIRMIQSCYGVAPGRAVGT